MSFPKVGSNQFFIICITACIGFTVFVDQTIEPQIQSIQAQVQKNTQTVYSMSSMQSDIHDMKTQLDQQTQDIADLKAEFKEKFP